MKRWTIRRSDRQGAPPLGTVEHRDIDEALRLARCRHGRDVTVDDLAWLREQQKQQGQERRQRR